MTTQWQPEDPGNVLILPTLQPPPPNATLIPQVAEQTVDISTDTETDDNLCGETCDCVLYDSRGWGHLAGSFTPCNGKFECHGGSDGCAQSITAGQACGMLAAGIDPATLSDANPGGIPGSYPTPCVPPWAADPVGALDSCDPNLTPKLLGCPPAFSRAHLQCNPSPGFALQPIDSSFPPIPFVTQWCGSINAPQNCQPPCFEYNGVCRCPDPPLPLASDGNGFAEPTQPFPLPVHPILSQASLLACGVCQLDESQTEESEL